MKFATDRRRARTFMCTRHVGGPLDAMGDGWNGPLNKVDAFRYEIPRSYKPAMRTNGLVFIDDSMLPQLRQDQAPEQVANVATMPGILGAAMAMPDIHWGYGFPIGGVAAFDHDDGVISPGGIGYDINCGVRLVRTNLVAAEVRANLRALTDACFENVPSGVGEGGITKVTRQDLAKLSTEGVGWSVEKGYAWSHDPDHIDARGCLEDADFSKVSERAVARGKDQVGNLGAGNHFVEIQKVDRADDVRGPKRVLEGPRPIVGSARHGHRLRCVPQHRESGRSRHRRRATQGRRPSERGDTGFPRGTSGDSGRVPSNRPTRPDPGGHGHVLVRPRRLADGDGAILRLELPRRRAPDVAKGRDSEVRCERGREIARQARDLSPGRLAGRDRRGSPRRVQERRGRRPGGRGSRTDENRRPVGPARSRQRMILTLQPVGRVDASVLQRIGSELAPFGEVRIATEKPLPRPTFGVGPKRYRAATFERICKSTDGDRIVAITNVKLSDPELGLTRVFGHADIQGRWAVVSLSLFGGGGKAKLIERAVKTSVHELGHTLGLSHHDANPGCVMFSSEELVDTDRKSRDFCPECSESAKATLSRLQT